MTVGVLIRFLIVLGAARCAVGAESTVELERMLNEMTSFRAEFEQTIWTHHSHHGQILQTSTGRMYLERPGLLRWEVDDPYPQVVIADGDSVWIYDPDLEQVTVQPLDETVRGSPAVFLTGPTANLKEHFVVERLEQTGEAPGENIRFVLVPLGDEATGSSAARGAGDDGGASLFRSITLTLTAEGVLEGIDVVDHVDQATRVVFTSAERNPVLESTLFDFEVPEGVDVLGKLPANPAAR